MVCPMPAATARPQVGPELRSARLRAGLSQEKLANLAGCSLSWVRQLELGLQPTASPKLDEIWRVLSALGDSRLVAKGGVT